MSKNPSNNATIAAEEFAKYIFKTNANTVVFGKEFLPNVKEAQNSKKIFGGTLQEDDHTFLTTLFKKLTEKRISCYFFSEDKDEDEDEDKNSNDALNIVTDISNQKIKIFSKEDFDTLPKDKNLTKDLLKTRYIMQEIEEENPSTSILFLSKIVQRNAFSDACTYPNYAGEGGKTTAFFRNTKIAEVANCLFSTIRISENQPKEIPKKTGGQSLSDFAKNFLEPNLKAESYLPRGGEQPAIQQLLLRRGGSYRLPQLPQHAEPATPIGSVLDLVKTAEEENPLERSLSLPNLPKTPEKGNVVNNLNRTQSLKNLIPQFSKRDIIYGSNTRSEPTTSTPERPEAPLPKFETPKQPDRLTAVDATKTLAPPSLITPGSAVPSQNSPRVTEV